MSSFISRNIINNCDAEFQTDHRYQVISNIILFWIAVIFALVTIINIFMLAEGFKITYSYIDPPLTGIASFCLFFVLWRNINYTRKTYAKFCLDL